MAVRKYWTLDQIRAKINRDLDLEAENFIRTDEMIDYINEGIDECEAEIHSLYEDYFLTRTTLNLVAGQEAYDLPENIYGHKIRKVTYNNTSSIYKVRRMKNWHRFEQYEIAKTFETSDLYQYLILNETIGNPQMIIVPKARDTGPIIEIWYIRQANRLENGTDICDIPEFVNFVFQYVKVRCYEKEIHPNAGQARMDLQAQRSLMQATLQTAQPDNENEIEMDMSYYEEMS